MKQIHKYENECSPLLLASIVIKKDNQEVNPKRQRPSFVVSLWSVLLCLLLLLARKHAGNTRHTSTRTLPTWRSTENVIRSGSLFLDSHGEPINAHGGGFLFHSGTWYWYGEIKTGRTYLPAANAAWGGSQVDLAGISCYASRDLLRWEHRGNVLPAVRDDPGHDLYVANVAERPKVVYNARTATFVMWLHVDGMDYERARAGVAVSDRPDGPFRYLGSSRPNGQMARDLTVFVDDDPERTAYLFTASENNAAIHISELSADYLSVEGNYSRALVGRYTEAPAVFKRRGRYYLVGSGCTAWRPNAARSATAPAPRGPWTELGNPCRGAGAAATFRSQSTYVLPLGGDRFLFAADRWDERNLTDSRYVWLPLVFDEDDERPIVRWREEWSPAFPEDAWPTPSDGTSADVGDLI